MPFQSRIREDLFYRETGQGASITSCQGSLECAPALVCSRSGLSALLNRATSTGNRPDATVKKQPPDLPLAPGPFHSPGLDFGSQVTVSTLEKVVEFERGPAIEDDGVSQTVPAAGAVHDSVRIRK
jgi:hypothetical protein